jgi:hypothetical protein
MSALSPSLEHCKFLDKHSTKVFSLKSLNVHGSTYWQD